MTRFFSHKFTGRRVVLVGAFFAGFLVWLAVAWTMLP